MTYNRTYRQDLHETIITLDFLRNESACLSDRIIRSIVPGIDDGVTVQELVIDNPHLIFNHRLWSLWTSITANDGQTPNTDQIDRDDIRHAAIRVVIKEAFNREGESYYDLLDGAYAMYSDYVDFGVARDVVQNVGDFAGDDDELESYDIYIERLPRIETVIMERLYWTLARVLETGIQYHKE